MGKQAKQRRHSPMAADPSDGSGAGAVEWPSAIRSGRWVDAEGTHWHLRGGVGDLPEKRVVHLLRSPEVAVLHFSGPHAPAEVALPDREALWQRLRPYHCETAREPDDPMHVAVAEFKDDRRRYLLVIEESG